MGRKSKAEVRKQEILEYFYIILREEGLEKTSIAKIAKRMDVNPSLLIHYFKTKEEMVVAFVERQLDDHEAQFRKLLNTPSYPEQKLNDILDVLFSEDWLNFSDTSVFYACYYLSSRNERIKKRFQDMYQRFGEQLLPVVNHWIRMGLIEEQEPQDIIEYLLMMKEGVSYYDQVMDDSKGTQQRIRYLKKVMFYTLKYGA